MSEANRVLTGIELAAALAEEIYRRAEKWGLTPLYSKLSLVDSGDVAAGELAFEHVAAPGCHPAAEGSRAPLEHDDIVANLSTPIAAIFLTTASFAAAALRPCFQISSAIRWPSRVYLVPSC